MSVCRRGNDTDANARARELDLSAHLAAGGNDQHAVSVHETAGTGLVAQQDFEVSVSGRELTEPEPTDPAVAPLRRPPWLWVTRIDSLIDAVPRVVPESNTLNGAAVA